MKKTYLDIISYPTIKPNHGIKYPNFETNVLLAGWIGVLAIIAGYLFSK